MCVSLYKFMCTMCVQESGGQKKESDLRELESHAIVKHHMGAGDWTQILAARAISALNSWAISLASILDSLWKFHSVVIFLCSYHPILELIQINKSVFQSFKVVFF